MNQPHGACEGGVPRPRARGGSSLLRCLTAAALALAALGAVSTPALAYGPTVACVARPEAQVFAPWGDTNGYFLLPNGDFENGSSEWALSGGAVVIAENEPYHVGGTAGSSSLQLPPGSAAESRTVCVSTGQDAVRLFVRNPHVSGAILHVDAIARNPTTGALGYMSFDVNGDVPSDLWSPTTQLGLPRIFNAAGVEELTLYFTLRGTPATWGIDDVYVDPFKSW